MNRLLGIVLFVALLYGGLMATSEAARQPGNQRSIAKRLGFYGVMTVGVGVLIVAGGIDLSIGSVVGLGSVLFGLMLERGMSPWLASLVVLGVSACIGLLHGTLVTSLGLQPFLVTLCGLFIYRGLARCATQTTVGLGVNVDSPGFKEQVSSFRELLVGSGLGVPHELIILAMVALLLGLLLHGTVAGRYLFALGANEEAAHYAGIPTGRYKMMAYVICSLMAGLASILEVLDARGADPTQSGNLYELFAITGAVLGGCSLRGGEGTIPGMVLGTAVIPLLRLLCNFAIPNLANELEYVVIGGALLLGTILDEIIKRRAEARGKT
jgi:ribose transport system permease protein